MDLATTYLGMRLPHPFLSGASPRADRLDHVKRLEDAGAAAIVMHSLFQEQAVDEQLSAYQALEAVNDATAEASSFFPDALPFAVAPDAYVEQVARIRRTVSVPVIAALDGTSAGAWLEYARLLEEAGAHALQLNVHCGSTEPGDDPSSIEEEAVAMVREVRSMVRIPLAVKVGPFWSSLPSLARRLGAAGADALVLFHRFHHADIDVDELEAGGAVRWDDPAELVLRLRWLAILAGRVDPGLAISGGVRTPLEAVKSLMCGARAVYLTSELLADEPSRLTELVDGVRAWLVEHEYVSLGQLVGSMSLAKCPDPTAYARANYVQIIQSRRP
jgi:dihydroorotate dehydrogenase (fumarate)